METRKSVTKISQRIGFAAAVANLARDLKLAIEQFNRLPRVAQRVMCQAQPAKRIALVTAISHAARQIQLFFQKLRCRPRLTKRIQRQSLRAERVSFDALVVQFTSDFERLLMKL